MSKDEDQTLEELALKMAEHIKGLDKELDNIVELGAMDEHEARWAYFKSLSVVMLGGVAELGEDDDDDAEDECDDCEDEDEESMPSEAKKAKEELDKFADALRDAGIADVSFTYVGHVHRKNKRS